MSRPRVLLVLKKRRMEASLRLLLLAKGYELKAVHTIMEALEAMSSFRPCVVLLDTDLGDGMEPCAFARAIRANTNAMIIVRSERDRREIESCLADEYLSSAATPQELLEALAKFHKDCQPST